MSLLHNQALHGNWRNSLGQHISLPRTSRKGSQVPVTRSSFFPTSTQASNSASARRSAMSQRINIARPPGASAYSPPSYSPDPHGFANTRPGGGSSSGFRAANGPDSDNPLDKLRSIASKIEDYIEIYSQPLKPHLPSIGRFLIIVTFLEDAWRIMTQWSDQLWYLQRYVGFLCDT